MIRIRSVVNGTSFPASTDGLLTDVITGKQKKTCTMFFRISLRYMRKNYWDFCLPYCWEMCLPYHWEICLLFTVKSSSILATMRCCSGRGGNRNGTFFNSEPVIARNVVPVAFLSIVFSIDLIWYKMNLEF